MKTKNKMQSMLLGIAVGDALGVPFEFMEPEEFPTETFETMKGGGAHNQPPGTFSDDSSLTFCLVESLIEGLDQQATAAKFLKWKNKGYWSARSEVFDIGWTTSQALENFQKGSPAHLMAPSDDFSCGNGALMRILPLAFHVQGFTLQETYNLVVKYASLTHNHLRSHMACLILVKFAHTLLSKTNVENTDKKHCYSKVMAELEIFFQSNAQFQKEYIHFERLLKGSIESSTALENSGYVIHSFEVALYCFMKYDSYATIVINAIKIGGDTDTNASISGGLAGLYYGHTAIPQNWLNQLARREDIVQLAEIWEGLLFGTFY